jgi:glucose/mannose-6-phosphate isomerase
LSILDDTEKIGALDPGNMYNRIFDLPEQMQDAIKISGDVKINADDFADIRNVVIVGMGGSAIGGDLVRTFLSSKLLIPFEVCRNYVLPEFVDDESLVVASSYSGNTEETLSALDDALNRKAMIAAISTGGILKEVSTLNDFPLTVVPAGLQPRAALGYSFVPLMMFLEKIGLIKNVRQELERVIAQLKTLREQYIEDTPVADNPAKQIAEAIHGRIAIVYSGPTLTDAVALRWKGQICENSKNLAFANHYPEFNHNELVGWSPTVAKHKDNLVVIQLRDSDDHPQITKRMDIVKGLIEKQGVTVIDVESQGDSALARIFSLIQQGDFVSCYLSVLNEVDPSPVDVIEELKKMLSEK